jgi:predicted flap endonuclease-1-like 5' DNA nuclease
MWVYELSYIFPAQERLWVPLSMDLVLAVFVIGILGFLIWWVIHWRGEKPDHPVPTPHPVLPAASAEAPSTPMTQYIPARPDSSLNVSAFPMDADDLTIITGITPSIADLLQTEGISTYAQLAAVDVARLKSILNEAHLGYWADPSSWPVQARLAAEGKMDDLQTYQQRI